MCRQGLRPAALRRQHNKLFRTFLLALQLHLLFQLAYLYKYLLNKEFPYKIFRNQFKVKLLLLKKPVAMTSRQTWISVG